MPASWFFVLASGFTSGIAFRSFFDFGFPIPLFFALLGIALATIFYLTGTASFSTKYYGAMCALFFLAMAIGVFRFDVAVPAQSETLNASLGARISLSGIIDDEPDMRDTHTRIFFSAEQVETERGKKIIAPVQRILVVADPFTVWKYGDRVTFSGILSLPETFDGEGGRIVDYPGFLAKDGIVYELKAERGDILSRGDGNVVKEKLFALKDRFVLDLSRTLPEPESSLLAGLTVGAKQSLGKELLDEFRATGIIHIVVLSGYNITIVAESVMRAFGFLFPRVASIAFGAASIVLFAIMTGASATVIRASLMALLVVFARATGRVYVVTIALIVAAFLMMLWNPYTLVFDRSFQLSFLATLAIIYAVPLIESRLSFLPQFFGIRGVVSATLGTQLFVLPLLLYASGVFSIVALPVNVLVLPIVPLAMFLGLLLGVFGLVLPFATFPFAFMAHIILSYALFVVHTFSSLTHAKALLPFFSAGWMVGSYILLALFFGAWYYREKKYAAQ